MTQTLPADRDGNLYFLAICNAIATSHLQKEFMDGEAWVTVSVPQNWQYSRLSPKKCGAYYEERKASK